MLHVTVVLSVMCCMCCLSLEPKSQFEIAFKLMDKDGSDYIDKNEFQLMRDSVATQRKLPVSGQGRYSHLVWGLGRKGVQWGGGWGGVTQCYVVKGGGGGGGSDTVL